MDADTERHGAVRPVNRVRVVYDGEPVSARVELVVTGDDGVESVHDIPVEEVIFYASPKASRVVLKIDGAFVTSHIEGAVDFIAEHQLVAVARLDPVAHGWGVPDDAPPVEVAQSHAMPIFGRTDTGEIDKSKLDTQPGKPKRKR